MQRGLQGARERGESVDAVALAKGDSTTAAVSNEVERRRWKPEEGKREGDGGYNSLK
jgi:hypothetical protein